eukprot:5839532-Lingulodinium_polyedra.AAC.1
MQIGASRRSWVSAGGRCATCGAPCAATGSGRGQRGPQKGRAKAQRLAFLRAVRAARGARS